MSDPQPSQPVRKLKLKGEVSPADLKKPEFGAGVERLTLDECQFVDSKNSVLPELPDLQHLVVDGGNPTSDLFRNLHSSEKLKSIRVNYWHANQLGDDFLAQVSRCSSLESLHVYRSLVTDVGIEHLQNLPHLSRLEIGNKNITDASADSLSKCLALRRLDLPGASLTDKGVRRFASLPNLTVLWLSHCPVSPDIGETLANIQTLQRVIMYGVSVNSNSASAFAKMPSLEKLLVEGECWTISDLEVLAESNSLIELDLDVSDEDDHFWTRLHRSDLLNLRKDVPDEQKAESLPFEYLAGPIRKKEDFLNRKK